MINVNGSSMTECNVCQWDVLEVFMTEHRLVLLVENTSFAFNIWIRDLSFASVHSYSGCFSQTLHSSLISSVLCPVFYDYLIHRGLLLHASIFQYDFPMISSAFLKLFIAVLVSVINVFSLFVLDLLQNLFPQLRMTHWQCICICSWRCQAEHQHVSRTGHVCCTWFQIGTT